ncbi:MAG: proline iminopeptidase-family hydrolase [Thermoplasmata archaeon]
MEPSEGYINVLGCNIYYRSFGRPDKGTVLALSGGPFGVHNGLLPMADLVQFGYRIVMYDYLGCGRSDRPKNAKYYTQSRTVDEVEGVRRALRPGRVHLLGLSYGGALALDVALRYPKSLRSLVISSGFASNAHHSEWNPHLPRGIRDTITRYSDKGDFKNPKYLAAKEVFNRTQLCRLRVWPYDLWYGLKLLYDDNIGDDLPDRLEGWDITDRLPEIRLPCLITAGKYDLESPKSARAIHRGVRGSKLVMFENCSHAALWEDRVRFMEVVRDFLDGVTARQ